MLQDTATAKENFERFLKRVRESGEVWGLESKSGWAHCPSHEFEDTDVLVFWSDRAYAVSHQKLDWKNHRPTVIPLDEFINSWLKGMHEDGVLVGPNWDANLCGLEVEPLDVAKGLED